VMAKCLRAGCTGEIDGGYCDVCGSPPLISAPVRAAATAFPSSPTPAATNADGLACVRADCPGPGVIEDGYCNVCGFAPQAVATPTKGSGSNGDGRPATLATAAPVSGSTSPDTTTLRSNPGEGAPSSRTGGSSGFRGGSRGALGAGLVEMPSVPRRDPQSVVLPNPEVPERKRFCARCGHEVGRTRDGRPGRTEGFCPEDGAPFSFSPKLRPGELVAGQYRVAGCIAHGGLGWIYLAQNLNLSHRGGYVWVVLKGLLDSEDEAAASAAVAERQFLAEVKHPNIVQIYNFVQHEDAGYIVMEYVAGESLRELRARTKAETGAPLPLEQAIAYMLAILPAFGYLHDQGLLYCDFKPDNAIQTDEQLTLIDLGGVVAMGEESDLFGTVGYQAPEVPDVGASISSDLYTVGRTLAVLSFDFVGFQDKKRYATSLPPVNEVPLFGRYEAFYEFLVKATALDPASRFQSADEMGEQLIGVLRQVRAIDGKDPRPAPSLLFSGELGNAAEASSWQSLPVPAVDPFDPAASVLATIVISSPEQIGAVLASTPRSPEVAFRLVRSFIEEGAFTEAEVELASPEAQSSGWRAAWWRGVVQLAAGRPRDAHSYFTSVVSELPGELAPRLALAVSYEMSALAQPSNGTMPSLDPVDDLRRAAHQFEIVAATDPGFTSASFGLSRVRTALGDRVGAVNALERIPSSSSSHAAAQIALCGVLCADISGRQPAMNDLITASHLLENLRAEPSVRLALTRDLQVQTLAQLVGDTVVADPDESVGGASLTEGDMRAAIEATYRSLAKLAHTDEERFTLVDLANVYRPRTLT
jgi:serine/threonine-protein kinase PknG